MMHGIHKTRELNVNQCVIVRRQFSISGILAAVAAAGA
jgi:hypothetical protein